jgi:hypothetical protein
MQNDAPSLRRQAAKCRMLAETNITPGVSETLLGMARDYEERARQLEEAEKLGAASKR